MKNAIILHGIGDTPQSYWFPFIKKELEKKQYTVWIPQLPQANNPQISIQLPFVLKNTEFTKETCIIGHSSGAALILSVLEAISVKIKQAILVSGFITSEGVRPSGIIKSENVYNWEKIRTSVENIIFINSDNDPWGCNDKEGRKLFDHLGGTLIIVHGQGHMGSETYNQSYKTFPLLKRLIE
jgi:predicted alpha/beta hydrolase family esterase